MHMLVQGLSLHIITAVGVSKTHKMYRIALRMQHIFVEVWNMTYTRGSTLGLVHRHLK